MRQFLWLSLVVCMILNSCSGYKKNSRHVDVLTANDIKPFGRFIIDQNKSVELISSAVHFGFSFEGKDCLIYASLPSAGGHNYLQYELDGVYQKRIRIEGSSGEPVLISAAKEGRHTVWIYKCTEATTGAININRVEGRHLQPLTVPKASLIEFIGNSITCGAAADASEIPCGTGEYHDHHNAYYAYGPRVGRALGVNYILSSVSGIGVYRNWNSDGPTMPQVYEKADLQENSNRLWDFSTYTPQVVSIALGTNDFSNGDGIRKRLPFDTNAFISHYVQFIQLVRSKYPNTQIALLSSPMVTGNNMQVFESCLRSIKQKADALNTTGKPVSLFFFKPMQAHGCAGHPSVEDHGLMAGQLVPFFKNLLVNSQ